MPPSIIQVTIIDAGVVTAIAPAFQPAFHAFLLDLCQGHAVPWVVLWVVLWVVRG